MTGAVIANVLWPFAAVALLRAAYASARGRTREQRVLAFAGLALFAVVCALDGSWAGAAWNGVLAVILGGGDFWNRRGRKVARELGAKSRAVLAAVVDRMREAGTPVPQGARP